MSLRKLLLVVSLAVLASACGRLGTGLPACGVTPDSPNAANVLSVQAVPGAAYSPCLNALELDWDEVEFSAQSGLVHLEFERGTDTFLDVRLTATCEIGDAREVRSGHDDVTRYEDVVVVEEEVRLTIVPDGERPLAHALGLAALLNGSYLEDRPLVVVVDVEAGRPVTDRVNEAGSVSDFVWIIGDIDIDEGTLAMKPTAGGEWIRGIEVDDALDQMEDMIEDIQYRGNWYLLFDGGCITYEFDTEGKLAVSIARQADAAIGLFRNSDLIDAARDAGFDPIER